MNPNTARTPMLLTHQQFIESNAVLTWSGGLVDPWDPDPAQIKIEDIAKALSRIPRFAGHTVGLWTVAQHSLLVAELVPAEHKLAALLHDATEAYMMDLPAPVKKRCPAYTEGEEILGRCIAGKFGFTWPLPPEVKEADREALLREYHRLFPSAGIEVDILRGWRTEHQVYSDFMFAYKEYSRQKPQ